MSNKPLTRDNLRGTWGTLLLPINPDDTIDFTRLEAEIDTLIASGVHGIYSNGSAGEFYTQSDEEYLAVNQLLASRCHAADLPFQIGACHPFAQATLTRIRLARDLEPDAFQVILPDWFPVRGEEVFNFLARICQEAAPAGIVLYNPPHAKRSLPPGEIGALAARLPGLLGVKVPGGDEAWYAEAKRTCGNLSLFIPGHHLATGIARGGHGAYSNVACLDPVAARAWEDLCWTGDPKAFAIERELQTFMERRIVPYLKDGMVNAAADKLLAAVGNWSEVGTRLRWPYRWVPERDVEHLRQAAQLELSEFISLRTSK